VAYTVYQQAPLRIWRATALPSVEAAAAGTVTAANRAGIDVATGTGTLRILELQTPGGRPLSAANFVNARNLKGVRLG